MKSLIEEASTIQKAVEKAWIRAGKPVEFTVKVFEEPKHNFLGMTTKSAKVAIFFKAPASTNQVPSDKKDTYPNQNTKSHERTSSYNEGRAPRSGTDSQRRERPEQRRGTRPSYEPRRESQSWEQKPAEQTDRRERPTPSSPSADRGPRTSERPMRRPDNRRGARGAERIEAVWSNEMADIAQDWLENMLIMLDKRDSLKGVKVVGENLKFEFLRPLLEDREKERLLFSSWAHLMLATVGNKYKKDLRGLRIVLGYDE